jgi:folate-dependent tRNA-U54 methylase TrmFO/GidA
MKSDQKSTRARHEQKESPGTHPKSWSYYRVQANLNFYAMVEFLISAENVSQARQKAAKLLDQCEPIIHVGTPTGTPMQVSLHPENVEAELIEIQPDDSPSPLRLDSQASNQLRSEVETEIGKLILSEMESLEVMKMGADENRANIHAGLSDDVDHDLFDDLWEAYIRLHPEQNVHEGQDSEEET